ncbi:hypothetical protein GLAREA_08106 [Glarea lozoyensis ATCC 20868]|uniref:Uncharacterized protein n=1 Tax=Glarea lozoyensis (strain ATCC 20868 / MF5171) TaxID=1116229 RepID=S3CE21_GLAL2|nr:uncharacterized protein GLAREA_08106 [Glarea lozoyensis ATCC 20868]EPE24255.1 hypothetical protein GLAREA_08106 [Glarea lozoyensis ATCC 20868]
MKHVESTCMGKLIWSPGLHNRWLVNDVGSATNAGKLGKVVSSQGGASRICPNIFLKEFEDIEEHYLINEHLIVLRAV